MQLASKMASAMHAENGDDPFGKIKGMISDMIAKLEDEAGEDATKKAYCDKELSETNAKKADISITELSSYRDSTKEELDAVLEYLSRIEGECIAKPESYEERKKRREAELAGL